MSLFPAQATNLPALRYLAFLALAMAVPLAGPAQFLPASEVTTPGRFIIDSELSWLRVLVYRGGLLRALGHNHVVAHHGISGTVTIGQDPLQSELLLEFTLADLVVDEPEQRALEGPDFAGQISPQDIAGTRANMLGKKLLQAERYPTIRIRSQHITGSLPDLAVAASVTVRGMEFNVAFPVHVDLSPDSFVATGELEMRHSDIGLKPLKAGLGTVRVRDALLLKYEISGTRSTATE